MSNLPKEHTETYREPVGFTAVSLDMKLEHTIQRAKKSEQNITDQTKISLYVTEWELLYDETLSIFNPYHKINNGRIIFF